MTNPAADTRKRMVLLKKLKRLTILSSFDQGNEPLDADMRRTYGFTGGRAFFIDGICPWYGLRVLLESRLFLGQPLIVCIRKNYRTDLGTLPAAGALGNVYKSGFLTNVRGKTTRLALKR